MDENHSPLPPEEDTKKQYNFDQALHELLNGKKITRIDWKDNETYGFLQGEEVWLRRNGNNHQWILSIGDITATDWVIVPEGN